jgi:hypothetical protein
VVIKEVEEMMVLHQMMQLPMMPYRMQHRTIPLNNG